MRRAIRVLYWKKILLTALGPCSHVALKLLMVPHTVAVNAGRIEIFPLSCEPPIPRLRRPATFMPYFGLRAKVLNVDGMESCVLALAVGALAIEEFLKLRRHLIILVRCELRGQRRTCRQIGSVLGPLALSL
jgi:hypothetical protein